jgi:NAD(P)-dependent dehydrogenase (short-subunit alcohol dehydrogenase family)
MTSQLGPNFAQDQALDLPVLATKEGCKGGTYIVTGSNTGLGFEAAKHFVKLTAAKVILAVRSPAKGEEAKSKIEAETGIKGVAEVWPLDMGSYDSIKEFASKVNKLERVDAIVENAGLALDQWSESDGMETTLIVNVTGTMLLGALILPKLEESAKKFGIQPHLGIVGSGVAFTVPDTLEKIDGDIIDALNDKSFGIQNR